MRFLDTMFLVDLLAGDPEANWLAEQLRGAGARAATPASCVAELLPSSLRSRRAAQVAEELLAQLEIVPLDEKSARRAGEVAARSAARGREVAMMDCLVAGIVLTHEGTLISRHSDFARVPGLIHPSY